MSDDDSATEEVIDEPTTKKKARQKRKRKSSNFNDDVSVETVGYAPSIVDNSNDLDDESNEEEEYDDNNQLNTDVPDMDWKMNCTGNNESLPFTGFTATNFTLEKDKINGFARKTFF